jgi:hypothetical protein
LGDKLTRSYPLSNLYPREAGLFVAAGFKDLDLSQLMMRFSVTMTGSEASNTASIRVYDLASGTAKRIQKDYRSVILLAGYANSSQYGVIFQGAIKQVKLDREDAKTSYVEMICTGNRQANYSGPVNRSLTARNRPSQRVQAAARHRDYPKDVAAKTGESWSTDKGVIRLNSRTGMIGVPVAANNGIRVRSLLNPHIKIGTLVHISNQDSDQFTIKQHGYSHYSDRNLTADASSAGYYRVLVHKFAGDTRGQSWYSDLICLPLMARSRLIA